MFQLFDGVLGVHKRVCVLRWWAQGGSAVRGARLGGGRAQGADTPPAAGHVCTRQQVRQEGVFVCVWGGGGSMGGWDGQGVHVQGGGGGA